MRIVIQVNCVRKRLGALLILLLFPLLLTAQSQDTTQLSQRYLPGAHVEIYKRIDGADLRISLVYPPDYKPGTLYPGMVFFFGGGWRRGRVTQFEPECRYFANRGMVTMSVDYRVESRQGTTPFESVKDARSAMRWIRIHAQRLGVQAGRIVAAGGSAGGHLALATALLDRVNEAGEDTSVSTLPAAPVLYNPVAKTTQGGYGYERLKERASELSPVEHVRPGIPPVIVFHGEGDTTVPIENIEELYNKIKQAGGICEFHRFPDQKHGFYKPANEEVYSGIVQLTDRFLVEQGFLIPQPDK